MVLHRPVELATLIKYLTRRNSSLEPVHGQRETQKGIPHWRRDLDARSCLLFALLVDFN